MDPNHIREENNPLENGDIRQNNIAVEDENALPNGNANRENNDVGNENAAPNGNAVRENNDVGNENAAPNGNAVRENNDVGNENAAPNGNAIRENNDVGNENAAPNGNAVRENNDIGNENAAPNGNAVRENNDVGNENAAPNGNAVRENNDVGNENAAPNGNAVRENNNIGNENAIPNGNARIIRAIEEVNFDLENVNFIPNDSTFKFYELHRRYFNIQGPIEYRLHRTTLEHIKNVFLIGLRPHFDELDVQVVNCPCLTRPPYNLAKIGLSGSPIFLRVGSLYNIKPTPSVDKIYDIRDELFGYNFDSFIIGGGFAAKPSMPYNGVLTMNATVALPDNANNNSRIAYEDNAGLLQQQKVNDSREMVCAMMGNFFISEGRSGLVVRVRIKGHRRNILAEIQRCLKHYCKFSVVLGGVFLINGGRVICSVTKENYPQEQYLNMHKTYAYDCKDLVAVGVVGNSPFEIYSGQETYDRIYTNSRFKFHVFSDGEPAGIYQDDLTPEETEYVGYFNIAERAVF